MLIHMAQHEWLFKAGDSREGAVREYYNFFHFLTPIEINVNGRRIKTRPNACVFSEPMVPRGFYFTEDTMMNWIHAYKDIKPLLEEYEIPLNCVFYPRNTGFISEIFQKMMQELYVKDAHKNEMLDIYAKEFVIKLSREIHGQKNRNIGKADQKKMRIVRDAILAQPEKNWTVEEMAKIASLSPSRFHTIYKGTFGVAPYDDLLNIRIDRAKTMLLLDEIPTVSKVAESLGYKNEYHFIRIFKANTGMTPGQFRKICK